MNKSVYGTNICLHMADSVVLYSVKDVTQFQGQLLPNGCSRAGGTLLFSLIPSVSTSEEEFVEKKRKKKEAALPQTGSFQHSCLTSPNLTFGPEGQY